MSLSVEFVRLALLPIGGNRLSSRKGRDGAHTPYLLLLVVTRATHRTSAVRAVTIGKSLLYMAVTNRLSKGASL